MMRSCTGQVKQLQPTCLTLGRLKTRFSQADIRADYADNPAL
jgi:hypothetical protein